MPRSFHTDQGETLDQLSTRVASEVEQGLARPTRILMEIQFHEDGTSTYRCSVMYAVSCVKCENNCGESAESQTIALCSECS